MASGYLDAKHVYSVYSEALSLAGLDCDYGYNNDCGTVTSDTRVWCPQCRMRMAFEKEKDQVCTQDS